MNFEEDRGFYDAALSAMLGSIIILVASCLKQSKKVKKKRKIWCRPWLERKIDKGILHLLDDELRIEDLKSYQNFLRLQDQQFEYLLNLVSPIITKQNTNMRRSISPKNKLQVTLRFLATGETFRSLMYSSRIHESTISRFIIAVSKAVIKVLKNDYLQMPSCEEEWKKIAQEFDVQWQFPHCIGAMDGKHIAFRAPISEGSYYYNYKGGNSIVLLALVDANLIFRYVNIGVNGRIGDGGVFNQSSLGISLKDETLNLPSPEILPGQKTSTPYVVIADNAFPSLKNLVKPYSEQNLSYDKKIFNYRLSRARRIVESAFGILANRFRVLLTPINLSAEKVEIIVLSSVLLHNFLASCQNAKMYLNFENEPVHSKGELGQVGMQAGNHSSVTARQVRDNFRNFFNSPLGSVPWQNKCVIRGNY